MCNSDELWKHQAIKVHAGEKNHRPHKEHFLYNSLMITEWAFDNTQLQEANSRLQLKMFMFQFWAYVCILGLSLLPNKKKTVKGFDLAAAKSFYSKYESK